jgi:hypothetical protein
VLTDAPDDTSGALMLRPQFAFARRLPAWLRPACRGAAVIFVLGSGVMGKLYALAVITTLMLLVGPGPGVVVFLGVVGLGMAAGAVGGAVYGLLEPLDYWGRIGAWFRWFPAILGSIITMILLTPRGPFSLYDAQLYLFTGALAALGAGFLLFLDDRRPGRLTPRQFEWVRDHPPLGAESDRPRPYPRHPGVAGWARVRGWRQRPRARDDRGRGERHPVWLARRAALAVRRRGTRQAFRRV